MKYKTQVNKTNPQWLRRLTWLTVAMQGAFPIACAFTPAFAAAQQHFLTRAVDSAAIKTRPYTLGQAETVTSVAKKYNISVEALRQLNQLRTFARGFDQLQAGDELDVPVTSLPEVRWQPDADSLEMKTASLATEAGSALGSRSDNGHSASAAANLAAGQANAEIEQWLNRFGTARVQLNADKHFSLKASQFDLLLPLSDREKQLVFTQGSFHRTEDRSQANLGLGIRHFAGDFMTGANAFFDYDLSRDHARSGLGLEYWRDFVKVSANGYIRLTSWKDSKDFADYQERPAHGWDIRTEAYLPAWPQLGAKLNYEQYYGNNVALFGKDKLQKNPHAITAGVTYTPFPLLTLEVEQRAGKDGDNDTRLGLALNYQIGTPWQQQFSGEAVSSLRSLAGNRYDLVNRNNNIVLDYRKTGVLKLTTASLVTGHAGEQKSLNVAVSSKYGVAHIDWSAAELIAQGGKIVADGPASYSVVLPAWHSEANGVNTYTISAVAVDNKGNTSNRAETQITVTEAAINVTNSSLTPASSILPADGHSQQTLTLTLKDSQGNPVNLNEKEISVAAGNKLNGAKVTSFIRQSAGQYTAIVTAGTVPEIFTVTPQARNITLPAATVNITADNANARIASLTVVKDNATANGQDQDRVKAVVTDAQGNPLAGEVVSFSADHNATIAQSATTNAQGEITVPVSDLKSGQSKVTARVGGDARETEVNFVAGEAEQFDMVPLSRKTSVVSGEPLLVQVSAKDANGNPVANQSVAIKSSSAQLHFPSTVMLKEDGTAIFKASATWSAPYYVTGSLNGHSKTVELDFTPGPAVLDHTTLIADTRSAAADGVSGITLAFTPGDIYDNAVSNSSYIDHSKDIHVDLSGLPGSKIVRSYCKEGIYITKIVSTQAGSGTVKVEFKDTNVVKSVNLSFTAPNKV